MYGSITATRISGFEEVVGTGETISRGDMVGGSGGGGLEGIGGAGGRGGGGIDRYR